MEDLTGKQFGQYQIVAPLGEGGMAAVYKAYQPAMERHVAIKVLPRHMTSSAEFVNRFRREARLVAQLQHPHILPVFDYGEQDGYPYIVMPFVVSGTLADVLRSRPLSLSEASRTTTQVGDALGYAHARGIIHRDIKPSNVLIDERGNCLLTDFGLARMAEAGEQLTTSGAIMGTPAYMSPEQGMGATIDARSDIYSLGIVLYEMVTGRVPYIAETPVAVVYKHIQDPLPPVHKFNPGLPESIELVLLKALAKDPQDRYQTAEDFVHAIQTAIPDTSLDSTLPPPINTVMRESNPPQPAQPSKKRILPTAILAAIVVLALGMLWLGGRFISQKPPIQPSPTDPGVTSSIPAAMDLVSNHPLEYLNDVQVLALDTFDDPQGNGWNIASGRVENGLMELTGNENWYGASHHGSLRENEGVMIDFTYAADSLSEIYVENGAWDTDQYRRFGVYLGSSQAQTNQYVGRSDHGGANLPGNLRFEPGISYSILIAILPEGELLQAIWNPSNISEALFYREKFDESWAGLSWTFWIGVNTGTIQFDNFHAIRFSSAK
jgi:serine/threonine protein kinase